MVQYYMDNPIISDIAEWLNDNPGRIAIGKRDGSKIKIYAFSDTSSDKGELHKCADKGDFLYITSVSMKGITSIEKDYC